MEILSHLIDISLRFTNFYKKIKFFFKNFFFIKFFFGLKLEKPFRDQEGFYKNLIPFQACKP